MIKIELENGILKFIGTDEELQVFVDDLSTASHFALNATFHFNLELPDTYYTINHVQVEEES